MVTPYTPVAKVWGLGMSVSGLNRGLVRYVQRLPIDLSDAPDIYDAGCGTGILGRALLRRYPDARVIATDADPLMCESARAGARRRGYTEAQFRVGQADIHQPADVTWADGSAETLPSERFDAVVAGAVLEHTDLQRSIPALTRLVRPGGWFVNVGMSTAAFVRVYEMLFHLERIPAGEIAHHLTDAGMAQVMTVPLCPREFPTNMTRLGVIARKPSDEER